MNNFQRPPIAAKAAVRAQPDTALARATGGRLPAGAFFVVAMVLATVVSMSSIFALRAVRIAVVAMAVASACAENSLQPGRGHDMAPMTPQTPVGTPHDFDFEHGRWRTTLRRLLQPLSGSQQWADYSGFSNVHRLLGGRANLVELEVAGPLGRIEGVSLRLFDTQRQRWTLNLSLIHI